MCVCVCVCVRLFKELLKKWLPRASAGASAASCQDELTSVASLRLSISTLRSSGAVRTGPLLFFSKKIFSIWLMWSLSRFFFFFQPNFTTTTRYREYKYCKDLVTIAADRRTKHLSRCKQFRETFHHEVGEYHKEHSLSKLLTSAQVFRAAISRARY